MKNVQTSATKVGALHKLQIHVKSHKIQRWDPGHDRKVQNPSKHEGYIFGSIHKALLSVPKFL
ncbi:unknown [Methanothermobacter thermautotrophicus str. Delta H]|uniref:Uncharacterized protein n=1 Tax=Methanothermobacter thermautotrophicus (strain ATCC 29096 / DSM 1053 / JCM 10044 / NBRC 100330 / Delta H) TaxID=187420 RepID=O26299_METTH|nr:unknown [Methanothermobacter thermautotrophicus str. Delta H]